MVFHFNLDYGWHAFVIEKISDGIKTDWRIYQSWHAKFTLPEWLDLHSWRIAHNHLHTDLYKTYGRGKELTSNDIHQFINELVDYNTSKKPAPDKVPFYIRAYEVKKDFETEPASLSTAFAHGYTFNPIIKHSQAITYLAQLPKNGIMSYSQIDGSMKFYWETPKNMRSFSLKDAKGKAPIIQNFTVQNQKFIAHCTEKTMIYGSCNPDVDAQHRLAELPVIAGGAADLTARKIGVADTLPVQYRPSRRRHSGRGKSRSSYRPARIVRAAPCRAAPAKGRPRARRAGATSTPTAHLNHLRSLYMLSKLPKMLNRVL